MRAASLPVFSCRYVFISMLTFFHLLFYCVTVSGVLCFCRSFLLCCCLGLFFCFFLCISFCVAVSVCNSLNLLPSGSFALPSPPSSLDRSIDIYIHTYIHTYTHTHIQTYVLQCMYVIYTYPSLSPSLPLVLALSLRSRCVRVSCV
jgi:hypothetical protein